ncbi:hypothetical protein [Paenibacillus tritici]|nr:hypothetical protein [Paenibacillus tritici]
MKSQRTTIWRRIYGPLRKVNPDYSYGGTAVSIIIIIKRKEDFDD